MALKPTTLMSHKHYQLEGRISMVAATVFHILTFLDWQETQQENDRVSLSKTQLNHNSSPVPIG